MTDSSKKDPFFSLLRRVRRRILLQRAVRFLGWTLILAGSAATLWVVVSRFFPQVGHPLPVVAGVAGIGFLGWLAWTVYRRPSINQAALEADQALRLKERITSSLLLADNTSGMAGAVHSDARRHLAGLNISAAFPFRTSRSIRWAVAPLLALGLTYWLLPEFDLMQHREKQAEAKARQEIVSVQVEQIRAATKALEPEAKVDAQLEDLTKAMNALAAGLEAGEIEEKAALAKISNLARQTRERREALAGEGQIPELNTELSKLGPAKSMAKAMQDGRMGDAAKAAEELMKKLKEGNLPPEEMEKLKKDLKSLSEMLGKDSAMAEALAKAAESLNAESLEAALESLGQMQMSLEDLQKTLEQMEQLQDLQFKLAQWQDGMMGEGEYCRNCGLKLGVCQGRGMCQGLLHGGYGPGMGGPGMGQGNRVGELPDVETSFDNAKATGPITKGQMLADILQKTAPDSDAQPTVDVVQEAFIEFRQEAEQALTQEEIPAGSREFVRQYFSSLEPAKKQP